MKDKKDKILADLDRIRLMILLDCESMTVLQEFIETLAKYEDYLNQLKKDRERK